MPAVSAAVSIVPRKNSRRVTLSAWENGNVSVRACTPTAMKYHSGAWAPPPYMLVVTPPAAMIPQMIREITKELPRMSSGTHTKVSRLASCMRTTFSVRLIGVLLPPRAARHAG